MATYVVQPSADSPFTTNDRGMFFLGRRNDSGTTQQASANGNYGGVAINASGWAWVTGNIAAAITGTVNVSATNTVTVSASNTVTVSASNVVTVSANNAVTLSGTSRVEGETAHDGVGTTTDPVVVGAIATAFTTTTADVSAGDVTRVFGTRGGSMFVLGGSPQIQTREWEVSAAMTNVVLTASAAGQKYVVTECGCHVGGSCSVNVSIRVGFATGSLTATATGTGAPAGILIAASAVIPGGGLVRGSGAGILGVSNDSEAVVATTTVPTGGRAKIWMTYFTVAS